ncbi:bactericidal permeability-increasing protein [Ciona intestinalis]
MIGKLIVFLSLLALSVNCQHPGIKIKGNYELLEFVRNAVVNFVEEYASLDFENVEATFDIANDNYKYSLINVSLNALTFGDASRISALPPRVLVFHSTSMGIALGGSYQITYDDSIVDSGDFSAIFTNNNFAAFVELTIQNEVLVAIPTNCVVVGGSQGAVVTGISASVSPEHQINLNKVVSENLKNTFSSTVCASLRNYLGRSVNNFFATNLAGVPIISTVRMDASVYGAPATVPNFIEIGLNGKCYPGNDSTITYTYPRPALIGFSSPSRMLKLIAGEYTAKTLVHALHSAGLLNVTPAQIAQFVTIPINTITMSFLMPGFGQYGVKPVSFQISIVNPPDIIIASSGVTLSGMAEIGFTVDNNGQKIDALILESNLTLSGNVMASTSTIGAQITSVQFTLAQKSSLVGNAPVAGLKILLDGIIKRNVVPALNTLLMNGFALPTIYGFNFTNLELALYDGAVELSGNIEGQLAN